MSYPDDTFERAMPIADAVLWEGYVLYPYRASAAKNRIRFQWGIVGPAEKSNMTATALVEHDRTAHVDVRIRFLHLHRRADGWDEAVERSVDLSIELLDGADTTHPITFAPDAEGQCAVNATCRTSIRRAGSLTMLRIDLDNPGSADTASDAPRDELLLTSMIGTHILFATPLDSFVSQLEPPEWAEDAVAMCVNERCWPVIAGPEPQRDLVLASPVILYDFPTVAPESVGDFFDGTEIDEMLTLRVQTLTDEEKAEARATDPRAAAIIDRCEQMPTEVQHALHGSVAPTDRSIGHGADGWSDPFDPRAELLDADPRSLLTRRSDSGAPDPFAPDAIPVAPELNDPQPGWSDPGPRRALVGSQWVERGDKVVLRPNRRADAHDLFLAGKIATVSEIVHTVDDDTHIAVTVDDDPAAELMDWHGRYLYFDPTELEPVTTTATERSRP